MSITIAGRTRKGKTKYEEILKSLFEEIGVHPIIDNYICLKCGGIYPLPDANKYPSKCMACGDFQQKDGSFLQGSYIIPDLVIKHEDGYPDSIGVIYVNGVVHTKHKQQKKDEHQIERLVKLGYRVFVFENEDVIALRDQKKFISHAALKFIYESIKFYFKYYEILEAEKEMAGIKIIRGMPQWAK